MRGTWLPLGIDHEALHILDFSQQACGVDRTNAGDGREQVIAGQGFGCNVDLVVKSFQLVFQKLNVSQ